MGEKAVPELQLDERPSLDLSDDEVRAMHKFSPVITGKFMKNQLAWEGYADIADATMKEYRAYILRIFSDDKAKNRRRP
jgi:hypothetical protein